MNLIVGIRRARPTRHGVMEVLRTGKPEWAPEISDSLLSGLCSRRGAFVAPAGIRVEVVHLCRL